MTRFIFIALFATGLLFSASVVANCVGSGSVSTCYDPSTGSMYSVDRTGNVTTMRGTNPNTGSQWSQRSTRIGSTTQHRGRSADGNTWSGSTTTFGNTSVHRGTDSSGQSHSRVCTPYGCF